MENPLAQVGQFFGGALRAAQQHPFAQNAQKAIKRFQEQNEERERNLYNTALIVRLVLTWFPNPPEFLVTPLSTVCDPYLNLFRGLIPPLGGSLDFSPILAFVVLNLFTNTAAALPCEVKRSGGAVAAASPAAAAAAPSRLELEACRWAHVSRGEALFRRRVAATRVRGWAAAQQ
eukprot:XP_001702829.1 predicted protein [Chlamydomonas reinhardtii]